MSMDIKDQMVNARIGLMLEYPFYGSLVMQLPLVEMSERMIAMDRICGHEPTFCTDYKKVYYYPPFAEQCSKEDKMFILAHETLHNALLHNIRMGNREPNRFNLAADFAINAILKVDFGYVPQGGCYDKKFENMSAEEIYNKLPPMKADKKGIVIVGVYSNGDNKIEIAKDGSMTVNGKLVKPFDTHMKAPGSKSERDEIEKDMQIQIAKALQIAKMAGNMPAGMQVMIEQLLEPKLDWRNMLRQFVITTAKNDFDWRRPNRRHVHDDMYMPSLTGESLGEIAVIVDVSGSTAGQDQLRFFSECNGLLQQYEMTLHLITADVEITSHEVYETGDAIKKEYKGMGGTEMANAFKYVEEKGLHPNIVICLTDGWTSFDFKSNLPTLWVITKDGVELDKIPFGMKVKMDE